MDRTWQDIRFALRGFRRTPSFVATAVIILAIGIGMSVAMFTIFRTVLVRRLPVVDQDRVVIMWTYTGDENTDVVTGTRELSVVRKEARTMREIAAVAHWPATSSPFTYGDESVELNRGMVTGNFFDVLGVRPALGRLFRPGDDEPPGALATDRSIARGLVLSHRAWREKFGGDSSIIGRRLDEPLLGIQYTILGVAPAGFDYPSGADYWIPMWQGWQSTVSAFAVARLAPGATPTAARDEYLAIERRLLPGINFRGAHVATFAQSVLGNVRPVLVLLTSAVALLLLIACLNVGNLLLLRASSRTREIAVRRALGARMSDIVRQLFIEALAIAAAGGVLGLGLTIVVLRLLGAYAPRNVPRLDEVQLAGAPVGMAIAIAALAVLIFGVGPAFFAARANFSLSLRLDSRTGTETSRRRLVRQTLVSSQIALAMIMLGGAALLARSLARLETQDTGFTSEHVSVFWYSWDARRYDSISKMVALGQQVLRSVQAVPGVTAATQLVAPPMLGNGVWQIRFEAEGNTVEAAKLPLIPTELCGPQFFKTFGVQILRGRTFTEREDGSGPLVAIVSESVVRRFWPNQDPIGKRIRVPGASFSSIIGGEGWRTVVGVAHETHLRTLRDASPMVFLPSTQSYWQGSIAIRSTVELSALLPALREAGTAVDPAVKLWSPQTMDEILAQPLAQPRLGALLMSAFGGVALLLAAIGLFGVMSALVRDQTRELGIRMALGATPGRVRAGVIRRASVIAGMGAAVGLAVALATSRLLSTLLFHISPTDPIALGTACLVLFAVAAAAAYIPARRATAIDPMVALRAE